MAWTWEISTGMMYDDPGEVKGKGYSGHPPYQNDVTAQDKVAMGPIPAGSWKMAYVAATTAQHGPFVIFLIPDSQTRALVAAMGRDPDSFRIHGERITPPPGYASTGCIILPREVREEIWNSADHDLQVVAELDPTAN